MDILKQLEFIICENFENTESILAIVATIGGFLLAAGKAFISFVSIYLSSDIEIALMSKRERLKYSIINYTVLTCSIFIMNIGMGWLIKSEKAKEICFAIMMIALVVLLILFIVYIYRQLRKIHLVRFISMVIKDVGATIVIKVVDKLKIIGTKAVDAVRSTTISKKNKSKENKSSWIYEKWVKTIDSKKPIITNFYTICLADILLLNIAVSGAVVYTQGISQRLSVSIALTVITMEVIFFLVFEKKNSKKARGLCFNFLDNKNMYIYFKNAQNNYVCGNSENIEECTEYYIISQEEILHKELKMMGK